MQNIRVAEIRGLNRSFPVISHSRVTKRGTRSWHVERNYDVKEDARVLDGKKFLVGQREIKEERKLDVVAEETAPRTFIRRIGTRFLTAFPNEKFGEFWWRPAQWENEKPVKGDLWKNFDLGLNDFKNFPSFPSSLLNIQIWSDEGLRLIVKVKWIYDL